MTTKDSTGGLGGTFGGGAGFVHAPKNCLRNCEEAGKKSASFSVPFLLAYGFFNFSEKASHKTRPQIKKNTCQFYNKTHGFVGNTVRLRALITPTDMKHVGLYRVFVVWVTSSCSKLHNTPCSASRPEGCFCASVCGFWRDIS